MIVLALPGYGPSLAPTSGKIPGREPQTWELFCHPADSVAMPCLGALVDRAVLCQRSGRLLIRPFACFPP
jgi:hypothetical protein